jgi:hypothetical protein
MGKDAKEIEVLESDIKDINVAGLKLSKEEEDKIMFLKTSYEVMNRPQRRYFKKLTVKGMNVFDAYRKVTGR